MKTKSNLLENQRKYRKSRKGVLMEKYRLMVRRVSGNIPGCPHHEGSPVCSREEFIQWAISDKTFERLYLAWEASGYKAKFHPSIDRIDNKRGYTLDNMQFLTHAANTAKRDK